MPENRKCSKFMSGIQTVVPADDKENARLIVSQIMLNTFEGLKMTYPKTSAKRRQELQSIRDQLAK
jgi:hypothetical protein